MPSDPPILIGLPYLEKWVQSTSSRSGGIQAQNSLIHHKILIPLVLCIAVPAELLVTTVLETPGIVPSPKRPADHVVDASGHHGEPCSTIQS